jgi:predicted AlkP superfamily pyrophosphatase or phosphodiesterase
VTWPNHTAIITGVDATEHKVLYNGLLTRSGATIEPALVAASDKEVLVHAPTVYDLAFKAGLTTAQVDWVAIYGAKTITWKFPEIPDPNGAIEGEMIADGTVTVDQLKSFEASSQAWQDEMWTAAAERIIEKHKPNLLIFHLLTLDDTNHEYGPMSPASFTGMALLDANVKRIVDAVHRAGLSRKTTYVIVSDHGFRTIKHKIHPNVMLRDKGLLSGTEGQLKGEAYVKSEGGTAMVYITNPDRRAELLTQLHQMFTGVEGIDHIYGAEDFAQLGLPTLAMSDQSADLVLAATPDYGFSNETEGAYLTEFQGGTHGFINSDPNMQAIFIASGLGVPSGVRIDSILNLDVAPTVAALLGLDMKNVKGRGIAQIVDYNHRH